MLQLQTADWLQVMQGGSCISEEVLQLPAVQQMTADQVGQLLQAHAADGMTDCNTDSIRLLATLPAAQQQTPGGVAELLLALVQPTSALYWLPRHAAWEALLQLPPAQQLSDAVLQQIIDTAADGGFGTAIHSLRCILPQAAELQCGLSGKQLECGILAALKREGGAFVEDVEVLMREAGMQSLCVQDLASLSLQVLRLPRSYDREVQEVEVEGRMVPSWVWLLDALMQLPAAQQLGSRDVTQLIQAFVSRCEAAGKPIISEHLRCLLELPAAREVSAEQLLQMLTELSQGFRMVSLWNVSQQLRQLPAWQRMTAADLVRILKLCLGQHLAKYKACSALCAQVSRVLSQHPASGQLSEAGVADLLRDILGRWGTTAAVVQVLLQHPAAAAIDAGVAGKLLAECIGSSNFEDKAESAAVMSVLLQLPAAQGLSTQQVTALVHQALHHQDTDCCKLLSTHPAAASGGDPELQMLLEVLQPQAFSMGYPKHSSRQLCGCPHCAELAAA